MYVYIKTNGNFKCVTSNIWIKKHNNLFKAETYFFFHFQKLCQCHTLIKVLKRREIFVLLINCVYLLIHIYIYIYIYIYMLIF